MPILSGPFFQVQQVQLNHSGMIKCVVQEASLKAEETPNKEKTLKVFILKI